MSSTSKKEQAGSEGGLRRVSGWTLVASVAVLVGFAVMVGFMANRTDVDDVTWSRLAWLLSSVEAIAFGAAGALFGASVQKDRAVAAERRADDNERDAVAGRTLAETIKAGAGPRPPDPGVAAPAFDIGPPPEVGDFPGGPPPGRPEPAADPYVDLARRLFPD
jgi:hypothetical protein